MNILVFSDSHGHGDNIAQALLRQPKAPNAVIFLGDGLRDMAYTGVGSAKLFTVCGNCDRSSVFTDDAPVEQTVTLANKRVFITHGHKYFVKSGYGALIEAAVNNDADIVLFGHTHSRWEEYLPTGSSCCGTVLPKPLFIMNPGSIGDYPYSWGLIEIDTVGNILLSHGTLI